MTRKEIDQRLFELDGRIRTASMRGWNLPLETAEYLALSKKRGELVAAEQETARQAEKAKARASVAGVLMPVAPWRPFIKRLARHAIDLVVQHRVTVYRDATRPRAVTYQRYIVVGPVLTESGYSTFLHEMGHVLAPKGDGFQHRYTIAEKSLISPMAEIEAWRWAVEHATIWTQEMQDDLSDAIDTYRVGATKSELTAITAITARSADRVVPAPDTLAGRERRVQFLKREDKVRQIQQQESDRLNRLRALEAHIAAGMR